MTHLLVLLLIVIVILFIPIKFFSANNIKVQCNVNGWADKTSSLTTNSAYTMSFYVNESLRLAQLNYSRSNWSINNDGATSAINLPEAYRPPMIVAQQLSQYFRAYIGPNDGSLHIENNATSTKSISFSMSLLWHY